MVPLNRKYRHLHPHLSRNLRLRLRPSRNPHPHESRNPHLHLSRNPHLRPSRNPHLSRNLHLQQPLPLQHEQRSHQVFRTNFSHQLCVDLWPITASTSMHLLAPALVVESLVKMF